MNVRFAQKATELLRRREMSLRAKEAEIDVPELTSPYPAAGFKVICPVRQVHLFASVDFSPEAVHIRPALEQAGTRFLPDSRNCRDGVAVLQQFVHALQHVV